MKKQKFNISNNSFIANITRIIAFIFMIGFTSAVIFAASADNLPGMTAEGVNLPQDGFVESIPDNTGDTSSGGHDTSRIPVIPEDVFAAITDYKSGKPSDFVISNQIYNAKTDTLAAIDLSPLGNLMNAEVSIRMGFIYVEPFQEVARIYDSNLNEVTAAIGNAKQVSARDKYGNPLFLLDSNYYVFKNGELAAADYNHVTDSRAFAFDYPAYLGTQNSRVVKYAYNGKYGYRTTGGSVIVTPNNKETFAWGADDVGAVNITVGNVDYTRFFNIKSSQISTNNVFLTPDNRSADSIGYFYFYDSLTRVRLKTSKVDMDNNPVCEEKLMLFDGTFMKLPKDYEIKGYSDGMILLKKDNRYGFMNSRGAWIVEPYLLDANPYLEGLAVVKFDNYKYGLVDTAGNYVLPPVFDEITNCSDGLIFARSDKHGDTLIVKGNINQQNEN